MGAQWGAHYIDDFITIDTPDSPEGKQNAVFTHGHRDQFYSIRTPSATRQTATPEGGTEFMEEPTQLQKEGITLPD